MEWEELHQTHRKYKDNIKDWILWETAYNGGKNLIEHAIKRHPRESEANYIARKEEAVVFNHARSVVDLYSFYLNEKDAMRDLGPLANDPQWQMFRKDCDLYGTDFNVFVCNANKTASIFGSSGILVDKPKSAFSTRAEEIINGVYPYCNLYTLPNILDWKHERNPINNRPQLTYLKLRDGEGRYIIMWPERWEIWEDVAATTGQKVDPMLYDAGVNELGEIPFFWFRNISNPSDPLFGISDIVESSRLTASIVRDLSSCQEIIKFAGFPMMRKPMELDSERTQDTVSVRSILEFNPEHGDAAKPDWLLSPVLEPIRGGLMFIEKKIDEIYQTSHMSGVHAMETSSEARSGVALRYQFSQLTALLASKSINMVEAEYEIMRLWLKWQNQVDILKNIKISRSKRFSVDDLSQDIDNLIKVGKYCMSDTLEKEVQKSMSRSVFPDLSDNIREQIDQEIDSMEISRDENGNETFTETAAANRKIPDKPLVGAIDPPTLKKPGQPTSLQGRAPLTL